jgi:hypothetical protein
MITGLNINENYEPYLIHMYLIREYDIQQGRTFHLLFNFVIHLYNEFKNKKK